MRRSRTAVRANGGAPTAIAPLLLVGACGAVLLASCAEPDGTAAKAEALAAGWRELADGSIGRVQATFAGDRRADRCWIGEAHDCVWLSERRTDHGRILVAGRTIADEPPARAAPVFGYSCAIYPSGAIEQRVVAPGGVLKTRWAGEGERWSRRDVRRRLAAAGLETSDVVNCRALRQLVADADVERLLSISVRRAVAPPRDVI